MAKQHCKTLGGRLFEPQSEEENKKVAQALRRDYRVQGHEVFIIFLPKIRGADILRGEYY